MMTITKKTTKAELIAYIEYEEAKALEHVRRLEGEIATITETRDKLAVHGTTLIEQAAQSAATIKSLADRAVAAELEARTHKALILEGIRHAPS